MSSVYMASFVLPYVSLPFSILCMSRAFFQHSHDVFEQKYPDAKLDHGHDAPIQRRPSQEEETQEAGANNRSHHGADEVNTAKKLDKKKETE